MNAVETLLHSSRPELAPCREHRDELRRQLLQREGDTSGGGLFSRRPDLAVLLLSASVAFVLLAFALTVENAATLPRSLDVSGMGPAPRAMARIAAPCRLGFVTYARMLMPRTQTADLARFQQALGEMVRNRESARRLAEDK